MATVVPFNQIRTIDQVLDYAAAAAKAAPSRCPYVANQYNNIMWEAAQATQSYGAQDDAATLRALLTKLNAANKECDQIVAAKGTASPINTAVENKPAPARTYTTITGTRRDPTTVKAGFPWLWGLLFVGAGWYFLSKGKKKRKKARR